MLKKIALAFFGLLLLSTPALASAQATPASFQVQLASCLSMSPVSAEATCIGQLLSSISDTLAMIKTNPSTGGLGSNFAALHSTTPNLAITGITSTAQLQILQSGTWTVFANSATTTDALSYAAAWGDASSTAAGASSVLSHYYATCGTYRPVFTVTDTVSGDVATASTTVFVSDSETSATPPASSCPNITMTLSIGQTDGQTGGQVSELQQFLTAQNFLPSDDDTGVFGPLTQQAVMQFQTAAGISPVGFVGPQTRLAIAATCIPPAPVLPTGPTTGGTNCVALTHNMGPDDTDATTGGDVTNLQNFLIAQGDFSATATGFFGPLTQQGVQAWQSAQPASLGLPTSGTPDTTGFGFVGPHTRSAINANCTGSPSAAANFSATPTSGAVPLSVKFTVGTSGTFDLDFGDGTPTTTISTTNPSANHTYTAVGTYVASLSQSVGGTRCTITYDPNNPASFLSGMTTCTSVENVVASTTITVSSGATTPAPPSTLTPQTFQVGNDCNGSFCAGDQTTANQLCVTKGFANASSFQTYPVTQSNPKTGILNIGGDRFYTGNEAWWTGAFWGYQWGGQCDKGGGCTPENGNEISQVTCQGAAPAAPTLPPPTALSADCSGSSVRLSWTPAGASNEWQVSLSNGTPTETINPLLYVSVQPNVLYDWAVTAQNFNGATSPAVKGSQFICYADTPNMDSGGS